MITEIKPRPISCGIRFKSAFRKFLDVLTCLFFKICYGGKGNKLPLIKDDILKQPAVEVARRIRNKEISSVEVTNACIRRIKETHSKVNCFIEDRYQLALEEAREVDKIIRSGSKTIKELENEKPFLGVPFTTKDSNAVKGLHITVGVVMRKDFIADKDSDVVRLMRDSGAIIIGLTNVPELCMWWETYNQIYGRTNNPYNTNRIVGGSSGGEGCIQALGGSCFGIGSDIGGSIRMPAFFNGIFGHKPTRLLVSNDGQHPEDDSNLHDSFLSFGPMTKFAVDLKPILNIISGENRGKLNLDQPFDIKNLKVFYQINSEEPLTDKVDADIVTALKKVVEFFKRTHNIDAKEQKIEWFKSSCAIWFENMNSDEPFGKFIMKNYSVCAVYKEIFKNMFCLSDNTLIALLAALQSRGDLNPESEDYKFYVRARQHLEDIFTNMLGENGVFLYPTHPTPAPYHNQPFMKSMNFSYTAIINSLGLPATTVPGDASYYKLLNYFMRGIFPNSHHPNPFESSALCDVLPPSGGEEQRKTVQNIWPCHELELL